LVGAFVDHTAGRDSGTTYLVLGPVTGEAEADGEILGENTGDFSGVSVSPAGDVDGDGARDLFIGAYWEGSNGSEAGAAYLVGGGER